MKTETFVIASGVHKCLLRLCMNDSENQIKFFRGINQRFGLMSCRKLSRTLLHHDRKHHLVKGSSISPKTWALFSFRFSGPPPLAAIIKKKQEAKRLSNEIRGMFLLPSRSLTLSSSLLFIFPLQDWSTTISTASKVPSRKCSTSD